MNPFDYVKSINDKGAMEHTRGYNPYLTNMSLSYHLDTIMLVQEMNRYCRLPPEAQYDFLFHTVRRGRRFSKWYKEETHPHLELVMEHYGYSKEKALEALQVLTQDNIRDIINSKDTGGRV